jgi:hypothetical protein
VVHERCYLVWFRSAGANELNVNVFLQRFGSYGAGRDFVTHIHPMHKKRKSGEMEMGKKIACFAIACSLVYWIIGSFEFFLCAALHVLRVPLRNSFLVYQFAGSFFPFEIGDKGIRK